MEKVTTIEQLGYLLYQHLSGQLTPEEEATLEAHLDEKPGRRELLATYTEPDKLRTDLARVLFEDIHPKRTRVRALIESRLEEEPTAMQTDVSDSPKVLNLSRFIFRAAAILIVILAAFWLFLPKQQNGKQSQPELVTDKQIRPGEEGAKLQLADGRIITLRKEQAGKLADQGNMMVYTSNGSLSYQNGDKQPEKGSPMFNSLFTGKGQQFAITLSDGSVVYLNALSSIRFPVLFGNEERKIEVEGEVFVEVVKDASKPFRVVTGNNTVEVKGTTFNINTYQDEPTQAVTLVEGSINLITAQSKVQLTPGQQAVIKPSGVTSVHKANMEEVIAWHKGKFAFVNADLKTIMRQLARWYDMEVEFRDKDIEANFNGNINRNEPVNELLDLLETTNAVHFTITGKKVIVTR